MITRDIAYPIDDRTYTGYLADGSKGGKAPGVLVCHQGGGLTDHARERARMLAELGYVAFALDMYGELATGMQHAMALIAGLVGDPPLLRKRTSAGLDVLKAQASVDTSRLAAIGYCFGGTTALELARSGADIKAAVGFHSGLATARPQDAVNIKAKILVNIGADDPIIPKEQRVAFEQEMTAAKVDWRMNLYGGASHSFTNPDVGRLNRPGFAYHAPSDRRSWVAMLDLFDEVFGKV
jgi:dienelactone hydrolase